MKTLTKDESEFLVHCQHFGMEQIRAGLAKLPGIDGPAIEAAIMQHLKEQHGDLEYLRGIAFAMIALLPKSFEAVRRVFKTQSPAAIYEAHFSMFVALNKEDLNPLEQDGIELLMGEYLMNVRSTAASAAWKAGLVLGLEWRSPRTEKLLVELMERARYPAGRLGAINGYQWLVNHRKTFLPDDLQPLNKSARFDPSERVRDHARFHLRKIKKEAEADRAISSHELET